MNVNFRPYYFRQSSGFEWSNISQRRREEELLKAVTSSWEVDSVLIELLWKLHSLCHVNQATIQ